MSEEIGSDESYDRKAVDESHKVRTLYRTFERSEEDLFFNIEKERQSIPAIWVATRKRIQPFVPCVLAQGRKAFVL